MAESVVVHRKRRNVELAMVLLAQFIGLAGYALTHINLQGRLPSNMWAVSLLWFGLGLLMHIVVRWRTPYADPLILPSVLLLNGIGLAMIHRIDLIPDPPRNDVLVQLIWTGLGMLLAVLVIAVLRDHRPLQGYTYSLFLAGLVLLLLPLVPGLGVELNGARIWIRVAGFSFQPGELAKLLLTIAFASYLVDKRNALAVVGRRFLGIGFPRPRDLLPIGVMWAVSLLVLVSQSDLGTSMLFFGLFVVMLYVSTERPGWLVIGALALGAAAFAASTLHHVQVRIDAWLHPFDNFDQNLQIISAQFGFAWGGLLGRGWGLGRPGLTPLSKSDFISAAIGEELGITGLMALIMVYALFVMRGLRIALAARDDFSKLLATGLSFVFALQVFLITGGVIRLLPMTGLTTPFMSQGGTSMIVNWMIVGLLLVISHQVRKPVATSGELSIADDSTQLISVPTTEARP
ncbi:cell division protein FtsW, lipid II flippase [Raineyella antarctica]|uniref:Cell division protein FtsW, lipid II flippase n=1 Tax=Raineyella antarctica TaxID=1577474 RepID=A0A1G6GFC2_9ACTN|nr:FtsW/RodA/SpoVE family cell cycle protein [Raineyella antarctica]SDB80533.1 cell division protein FtsW, lipid II flippase [Raineyella antarctica]